jgi:hypothetical protein
MAHTATPPDVRVLALCRGPRWVELERIGIQVGVEMHRAEGTNNEGAGRDHLAGDVYIGSDVPPHGNVGLSDTECLSYEGVEDRSLSLPGDERNCSEDFRDCRHSQAGLGRCRDRQSGITVRGDERTRLLERGKLPLWVTSQERHDPPRCPIC